VVKGGELRAQKQCASKPLMMALQSHDYIVTNSRLSRGHPLGVRSCFDPEEDPFNEKGLIVEASDQSISRRHESSG
jgi:hypothetical protein